MQRVNAVLIGGVGIFMAVLLYLVLGNKTAQPNYEELLKHQTQTVAQQVRSEMQSNSQKVLDLQNKMQDIKDSVDQGFRQMKQQIVPPAPQKCQTIYNPYGYIYEGLKSSPPEHIAELHQKMKAKLVATFEPRSFGCADFAGIYPMMASIFDGSKKTSLIDIGANLGHTSSDMLNLFTKLDYRILIKDDPSLLTHVVCKEHNYIPKIVAVEAMPSVYDDLKKRAVKSRWEEFGWTGLNMAAVGKDDPAQVKMSGPGPKELFKILPENEGESKESATVKTITLDALVKQYLSDVDEIFLLKIDAEGFDPKIISGGEEVIASNKVRFIHFEYNSIWRNSSPGWTLKRVQEALLKKGYFCWFLEDNLYPISGEWWDDKYEIFEWSNIFASRTSDGQWLKIVNMFNKINEF